MGARLVWQPTASVRTLLLVAWLAICCCKLPPNEFGGLGAPNNGRAPLERSPRANLGLMSLDTLDSISSRTAAVQVPWGRLARALRAAVNCITHGISWSSSRTVLRREESHVSRRVASRKGQVLSEPEQAASRKGEILAESEQAVQHAQHEGGGMPGGSTSSLELARYLAVQQAKRLNDTSSAGIASPGPQRPRPTGRVVLEQGPEEPVVQLPMYWRKRGRAPKGVWPKVYLYKLPPKFYDDTKQPWISNYGAESAIPVVLRDMGHVVEDPEEADLYYVDAWFFHSKTPIREGEEEDAGYEAICMPRHPDAWPDSCTVLAALDYIRWRYPFYNRSQGVDHIWPLTWDHGMCGFHGSSDLELADIRHSIIAEHWGNSRSEFYCPLSDRLNDSRCYDHSSWMGHHNPRLPCYVHGKDVLMPSAIYDQEPEHAGSRNTILEAAGPLPILPPSQVPQWPEDEGQPLQCALGDVIADHQLTAHVFPHRKRNNTLFFSGSTYSMWPSYSHGVRQTLIAMFKNNIATNHSGNVPGFDLYEGYVQDWLINQLDSQFCLAATGFGYGIRFKAALLCGCIPVVIADDIAFENNDVFDLRDISIRLPQRYLYLLPEVLDYLQLYHGEMLRTMQSRIACAWQYWVWTVLYGKAGEAFVCSLRRKLLGHDVLRPRMDWDSCTLHCDP